MRGRKEETEIKEADPQHRTSGQLSPWLPSPSRGPAPTWMSPEMGRAGAEWPQRAGRQQEAVSAARAGRAQQGGGEWQGLVSSAVLSPPPPPTHGT